MLCWFKSANSLNNATPSSTFTLLNLHRQIGKFDRRWNERRMIEEATWKTKTEKEETFWRRRPPLPTLSRQTIDVTTSLFLRLFLIKSGRHLKGFSTRARVCLAQSAAVAESKSAKKISAAFSLSERVAAPFHECTRRGGTVLGTVDGNAKVWQRFIWGGEGRCCRYANWTFCLPFGATGFRQIVHT